MSRSSSQSGSHPQQTRELLSKAIEQASCQTLTDDEVMMLNDMLFKYPNVAIDILEPSIHSFSGMIEWNAGIFRSTILPLLLSSPLQEESPHPSPDTLFPTHSSPQSRGADV